MGNKQTLGALHELLADADAVGAGGTPQAGALRARIEAAAAWAARASEFFGDLDDLRAAPAAPNPAAVPPAAAGAAAEPPAAAAAVPGTSAAEEGAAGADRGAAGAAAAAAARDAAGRPDGRPPRPPPAKQLGELAALAADGAKLNMRLERLTQANAALAAARAWARAARAAPVPAGRAGQPPARLPFEQARAAPSRLRWLDCFSESGRSCEALAGAARWLHCQYARRPAVPPSRPRPYRPAQPSTSSAPAWLRPAVPSLTLTLFPG